MADTTNFSDEEVNELRTLVLEFNQSSTTEERRKELIKRGQEIAVGKDLPTCPNCKKIIFWAEYAHALVEGHVYSRDGIAETGITGLCEFCFDEITKEPDEGPYITEMN